MTARALIILLIVSALHAFPRAPRAADCTVTSVGLIPLTDLGAGLYQGFAGGLYPGGANTPPAAHDAAFLAAASAIVPLDTSGNVDTVNGKIGFTTIGMSNTSQHSQAFLALVQDPVAAGINPQVVFFKGAQSGQSASQWSSNSDPAWDVLEQRTIDAGLTNLQVQVVWVLQAQQSTNIDPFPVGPMQIQGWLASAMQILKARFPNVRLAYFSSRIYAGYASTNLNPEPCAYETAFAVKWLIEQQIGGDPGLAHDGPTPQAPLLVWGPYPWADGLGPDGVVGGIGGRSDGLEWECSDLADDGTHPSSQGAAKTAQMLFDWLSTDAHSQVWFLPPTVAGIGDAPARPPRLLVTPNPTRGAAWLQLPATSERVEISVFDVSGRLVDAYSAAVGDGQVRITLSGLSSGVYFVRAQTPARAVIGTARVTVIR
jgi:hypothetical protein